MRWLLSALAVFLLAATTTLVAQNAVPGGHEAFNYWFNGTKWVEVSGANPLPVGTAAGGITVPQVGCTSTAIYDASTAGSSPLVVGVAGQTVYLCGYSIYAAGTSAIELDGGTGATCAANTVKLTPAWQFQTAVGIADGAAVFRGLKTAAGSGLCIKSSAAVAVQAIVYYAQF